MSKHRGSRASRNRAPNRAVVKFDFKNDRKILSCGHDVPMIYGLQRYVDRVACSQCTR